MPIERPTPGGPTAPTLRRREQALAAAWLVLPTLLWAVDFLRHRDNTFRIYRQVFWHLVERRDLYAPYPAQYADVNLYGPVFGLVIAPFAAVPEALGGLLWSLAMAAALWGAISRLRLAPERRLLVLAVVTLELLNALWSNQFNPGVAALLLMTLADVEDGRELRAPLWALLGAFVKVYGAELTACFEIVVVNDGSRDGTRQAVLGAAADCNVLYLELSRNFGKEAALSAGLEAARGEVVVILDGDGQHPLAAIPAMLER